MKFLRIFFTLIILFTAIIKTGYSQQDYSGIYEGKIDVPLGEGFTVINNGWIAFDFSGSSPVVLYDGVFTDGVILSGKKLTIADDSYPKKNMGNFDKSSGEEGLSYIYRIYDDEKTNGKTFLKKTGNLAEAQELIAKYKNEKEIFESFFIKLKDLIIKKDYEAIASYGLLPIEDHSCTGYSNNKKKTYSVYKELAAGLKFIFENSLVNVNDEYFNFFRLNDNDQDFPGGIYVISIGGQFHFRVINNEVKLTAILCYG